MSDDHAIIVEDGATVVMEENDKSIFKFDWDTFLLNSGVHATTPTFRLVALRPTNATGLTKDNEALGDVDTSAGDGTTLHANRYTIVRLIAGGASARGQLWQVFNQIITDETVPQTKERSFRVLIGR